MSLTLPAALGTADRLALLPDLRGASTAKHDLWSPLSAAINTAGHLFLLHPLGAV